MRKNSIPQLVELSQKGDSNAFELLFTTFKTRLHHSLFKVLRNYHETEDVVQQAFMRAWEKIGTFKGNSNFYTWLYRIGFNLAITKINSIKIKEGMILSNEPGYYQKGKFGIRIENLVFVKKNKNKLFFENLTLAPIEKDLINHKLLNSKEKDYLFKYHLDVYSKISKFLNPNERKWLAGYI